MIQAYEEETIYILTTAGAQEQMEGLRAYRLSLRPADLEVYLGMPLLEECGVYRYIYRTRTRTGMPMMGTRVSWPSRSRRYRAVCF